MRQSPISRKHIRRQELSREVSSLKGERDGALEECEKLRLQKSREEADAESRLSEDSSSISCATDLTSSLELQLQRTQYSNSVRCWRRKTMLLIPLNSLLEETKKLVEDKEMDSGHNEIDTLEQQMGDLDWKTMKNRGNMTSSRRKTVKLEQQEFSKEQGKSSDSSK